MRTKFIVALSALALPLFAVAHPGHGHTDGHSFWHYFMEPKHALAAVLLAVGVGVWMYRSQASRNEA